MGPIRQYCETYRTEGASALAGIDCELIETAISWIGEARDTDRCIFVCGNGGSASTASHFATDLGKGASYNRTKRFRVQALTDSLSTITAYGNDVSYDCIFAEQLKNAAKPNDILVCISGSGNSPNVIEAARVARRMGCRVIALTGRDGGKLASEADLHIATGQPHMGRIEDLHLIICHMIGYYFMDQES